MSTDKPTDRLVWNCETCRIRGRVLQGVSIEHVTAVGRSERGEFAPACHHGLQVTVLAPGDTSPVLDFVELPK